MDPKKDHDLKSQQNDMDLRCKKKWFLFENPSMLGGGFK